MQVSDFGLFQVVGKGDEPFEAEKQARIAFLAANHEYLEQRDVIQLGKVDGVPRIPRIELMKIGRDANYEVWDVARTILTRKLDTELREKAIGVAAAMRRWTTATWALTVIIAGSAVVQAIIAGLTYARAK